MLVGGGGGVGWIQNRRKKVSELMELRDTS